MLGHSAQSNAQHGVFFSPICAKNESHEQQNALLSLQGNIAYLCLLPDSHLQKMSKVYQNMEQYQKEK